MAERINRTNNQRNAMPHLFLPTPLESVLTRYLRI